MTPAHDFWVLWIAGLMMLLVGLAHLLGEEARAGRLYRIGCGAAFGIAVAFAAPPLWRLLVLVWAG